MYVSKNVEFVVNTSKLVHWKDVKTDMVGVFFRSGTKSRYFNVQDDKVYKDDKVYNASLEEHNLFVKRFTYVHKKYSDFHKVMIIAWKKETDLPCSLVYVQYYFERGEHDIDFSYVHGNSKTQKTFCQTTYSVKENIKSYSKEGFKGKTVLKKMNQSIGGFEKARISANLPASLNQIYDIARKHSKSRKQKDEILELVDMCNEQKGLPTAFIREVRTAPELSVVLTNNRQLNDIKRFAVDSSATVIGVDPTFNICHHNVTVSTYRHPMLKVSISGVQPVMIGPILLHAAKTFQSYYTLPSTMVRLKPSLASIRAFGTDGETEVYETMKACFPKAKHLLCWIHVRDNIEKKLSSLKVNEKRQYIEDIFGKKLGEVKIKGLLDVTNEVDFESEWNKLEEVWKQRGQKGCEFLKYMIDNKKEKMKCCMIGNVREECGLGSPPEEYNQNANEAINSVLKKSKGKGKLSVKETVAMIQQEVKCQEEKIKMALLGRGEWKVSEEFKRFEITEEAYYKLDEMKRNRYVTLTVEIFLREENLAISRIYPIYANLTRCQMFKSVYIQACFRRIEYFYTVFWK